MLADAYRGQRIRLSAWVRYTRIEGVSADEVECPDDMVECIGASLWMRVDGLEAMLEFANTAGSGHAMLGTNDEWQQHSLVLDVPKDAVGIAFGAGIDRARGTLLVDDFQLEIVADDVASTNLLSSPFVREDPEGWVADYNRASDVPSNLGFEAEI